MAWRPEDPYLFNTGFDSSSISHDDAYCTSVVDIDRVTQVPTLTYVRERVLAHLPTKAHVVDIGCGQGGSLSKRCARGAFMPLVLIPYCGDTRPTSIPAIGCPETRQPIFT